MRQGLTERTATVLGSVVGAAVPVQRHPPKVVVGLGAAELVVLGVLIATGWQVALIVLVVVAAALLGLAATNTRRIIAVTATDMVIVAASLRGRPQAPIGRILGHPVFPEPAGVGVQIAFNGEEWWVDRSAFPRLRRARELLSRMDL